MINSVPSSKEEETTKKGVYGYTGKIVYLDRQEPTSCSSGLLQNFQYKYAVVNSKPQVWMKYNCLNNLDGLIDSTKKIKTNYTSDTLCSDSVYSTNSLVGHNIDCGAGYGIRKFKLLRTNSGTKIKFLYTCVAIKTAVCMSYVTFPFPEAGIKGLTGFRPGEYVPDYKWSYLQAFVYQKSSLINNYYLYKYTTCSIPDLEVADNLKQLEDEIAQLKKIR
jgi:hypothetical protein